MAGGRNQFSLYESPTPWGPWSVIYFTESWEGGPILTASDGWGESAHIPSKWISADGATFYLVYAGDDAFSVRHVQLTIEPDNTNPTIRDVVPSDGQQVTGQVTLAATVTDNYGVERVRFEVDNNLVAEDTAPPFQAVWDSSGQTAGPYQLTVIATDTSGNQSSSITAFELTEPDLELPSVSLTAPADGATVSGLVPLTATASDNVSVTSVMFLVEGALLSTDTTSSYTASWDSTSDTNGSYQLTARACTDKCTAARLFAVRWPERCGHRPGLGELGHNRADDAGGLDTSRVAIQLQGPRPDRPQDV